MSIVKAITSLAFVLVLGACAAERGTTTVQCSQDEEDGLVLTDCDVFSAKEYDVVEISGSLPDGTRFSWKGMNVRAFEGQKIEAEIRKELIQAGVEITPAVVEAVSRAVTRSILP